jgi:hypothetical protein
MGTLSAQEAGPAGGTGRACAEGVSEHNALFRELLQIGRRDGMAIGLDISAGIVGMEIKDVERGHGHTPLIERLCGVVR